jgi:hypothetical protein
VHGRQLSVQVLPSQVLWAQQWLSSACTFRVRAPCACWALVGCSWWLPSPGQSHPPIAQEEAASMEATSLRRDGGRIALSAGLPWMMTLSEAAMGDDPVYGLP